MRESGKNRLSMISARDCAIAAGCLLFAACSAQTTKKVNPLTEESYIQPSVDVASAALAPWYKNVSISNLSPDGKTYVVLERDGMPSLAALGKEHVNLGGFQVDVAANRSRDLTTRSAKGFRFVALNTGQTLKVPLKPDARVSEVVWSRDSKMVAFLAHFLDRSELWVANASDGKCHQVTAWPVLATMVTTLRWTMDDNLITVLVPKGRAARLPKPEIATTPKVKVSDGKATSIRTYPSLLQSPYEGQLVEFYATGQLAKVDVATGTVKPIGKPAMIRSVDPAPDGKYFLVTVMERPFSMIFPVSNFPQKETIWDDSGAEKALIQRRGLQSDENPTPAGNARTANARRLLEWRPDGAGLSYVQVEPAPVTPDATGGGFEDEQARRGTGTRGGGRGAGATGQGPQRPDQVFQWLPPFSDKDAHLLFTLTSHINSLRYSPDMKALFLGQTFAGKDRTSIVRLDADSKVTTLTETGTTDDAVNLASRDGSKTGSVVRTTSDGKFAYLVGTKSPKDAHEEAPRPFIDKIDLATGKRENVFISKADAFEQATLLDDDMKSYLLARQSPKQVPNTFLVQSGVEKKLTENIDYVPDLTQAHRETITITRQDGFKFQVKVTFPKYFTYGVKPPAFFWFYPSEFVDQAAYDRSKKNVNKNLFTQIGGANKAILTRLGYAVIEPDCPIVGPADRKNDEYVPQLRNNLAAVIDELDRRGWIDRSRLGIGGHSYGAFSTANAMVNTPFFKAGIAGDGNFNRSLTPFGFQTDDRQLWDGRAFYLEMSPFLYAERMTGALLMYHGMEDQNIGTDPINSERMFDAMEALGKTAALYKYPYEDHGQVAKETILDQWARFVAWLDKYVKNAK